MICSWVYFYFKLFVEEEAEQEDNARLRCETFDIERVLEHGAHLMGSEGHEYDMDEEALAAAGDEICQKILLLDFRIKYIS